ncbi:MAG: prolyl-tRNA synthetase associated domain-containing protein [Armatimonadetes bacterium]|nr:prolyl-tRNA synthetase associated domain-containing protein [Armatimonadota bacterium]
MDPHRSGVRRCAGRRGPGRLARRSERPRGRPGRGLRRHHRRDRRDPDPGGNPVRGSALLPAGSHRHRHRHRGSGGRSGRSRAVPGVDGRTSSRDRRGRQPVLVLKARIYDFLERHGIRYQRCDHLPVYTCEEAERLVPELPGTRTKNLFLRDRKGKRHFLVSVGYEKQVDLKALCGALGADKLSLGSPERLEKYLGVEPGSVTLLGVVNDRESPAVEVVLDRVLWEAPALCCHPLVNTATLVIPIQDVRRLLELTGHTPRVIDVPERTSYAGG